MLVFGFRTVRASIAFLTCIPVGGHPYDDAESRWAVAHFPLVGAGLGALLGAVHWLCTGLGPLAAAVLVVALSMFLTGALHEDGLADTADALGATRSRERIFQILKDSRIGTYGAAALSASILLRVALLTRLELLAPAALIIAHSAARLCPVAMLAALPYVTPDAQKSVPFAGARAYHTAIATAWVVLCTGALVYSGVIAIRGAIYAGAVTIFVGLVCSAWFRARIGGITGDFLGATEQIAENAILIALTLAHAPVSVANS